MKEGPTTFSEGDVKGYSRISDNYYAMHILVIYPRLCSDGYLAC